MGCVIFPISGADGAAGGAITALSDLSEVHPPIETVNLYVSGERPDIVVLDPVPLVSTPPGVLVSVHSPEEGSPVSWMLPAGVVQVG